VPLRLYTDEHVPTVIAEQLRRRGIDAESARDAGNLGLLDEDQLAYATHRQAVLFTHDTDFLRLASEWKQSGKEHWGILFAPARRYSIGESIRRLVEYALLLDAEDMRNCVEFLGPVGNDGVSYFHPK